MTLVRIVTRLPRWALLGVALLARGAEEESTIMAPTADELATIRAEVAVMREKLGDRAGVPELDDKFIPIPKDARWLSAAEAQPAFAKAHAKLEQLRWWKIGLDPTTLRHALREPASVISGCVHAARAGLDGGSRSLALAREAADFLLWAQEQGGTGVFPFPAVRGYNREKAFVAADRFIKGAESRGRLDEVVHHGWIVADMGDGGLQFDTAEAGIALLELSESTHDMKYLAAAGRAADWAVESPLARNWNYNSFSVSLLAEMFRVTGQRRYLNSAVRKALLGVIPGQLTDGPHAGRWVDAHNARVAYHYIMMRSLTHLAAALPKDHAARPEILRALKLGLLTRNQEILGSGATNKDKAVETLVMVNRVFARDADFLRETKSAEALDALGKLVSAQYRQGSAPLGPREWGLFLEYVVWRAEQAAKNP
jgi:hypothetical protein